MEDREKSELIRILREHAVRYPLMRPADVVKLIFQNEFGGEHLISNPEESLARLRAEAAGISRNGLPGREEEIGGGLVRFPLSALEEGEDSVLQLNRDFVLSAGAHTGKKESLVRKLSFLTTLAKEKVFAFSEKEAEDFLAGYLEAGCPPLSHSPEYKEAYHPSYRVLKKACSVSCLLSEIRRKSLVKTPLLVALDGRCAAGKTTFSRRLRERYGWTVVPMDHFFLRPEQRTEERLREAGGNIDFERFAEEVLLPLHRGENPAYRPYCCKTGKLLPPVCLPKAPVILAEGSYACHPALWPFYNLRVFLSVSPEEQARRLVVRNGPEEAKVFQEKWIPLEEQYFSALRIEERCDYRIKV